MAHAHSRDLLAGAENPDRTRVEEQTRARVDGGDGELDAQALGVLDLTVGEQRGTAESIARHAGEAAPDGRRREDPVPRHRLVGREHVVREHSEPDHPRRAGVAGVERHDQAHRLDQVRCHLEQQFAFAQRLAHESDVAAFEIAQAAVDESPRPGGDSRADVLLLDERDGESALGGIPGDAQSVDAGADHDDVEGGLVDVLHVSLP